VHGPLSRNSGATGEIQTSQFLGNFNRVFQPARILLRDKRKEVHSFIFPTLNSEIRNLAPGTWMSQHNVTVGYNSREVIHKL
jgi:hypothetical protein